MSVAIVYVLTLIPFLVIDIIGIRFLMLPLFEKHVSALMAEETRLEVAAGFYLFYVVGIVYFAVMPALREEDLRIALTNGAMLGLLAYGTYEMTNMATLRGWSWTMVMADMSWGMIVTASTAAIGFVLASRFV